MPEATSPNLPASSVPFHFFVELAQAISAIKPHTSQERQPRNTRWADTPAYKTFNRWLIALRERYSPLPAGTTAAVLLLLFPEEDVRRKYGMQEARLGQHILKIIGASSLCEGRGENLRRWNHEGAPGCLGNEVEQLMASSSTRNMSDLSLNDVDALLSELAATSPFSATADSSSSASRRSREAILTELYTSLSPFEGAVVTQIILKDLRPLLYPIPPSASHYTSALIQYKSNAVAMLTKEAAVHAWDPSGRMSIIYKNRAKLEDAARAYEICAKGDELPQPVVGTQIQIPKCVKGQGPAHSLKTLRGADKVWVETKYDGERAQIHVWLDDEGTPHIRIFSKSGRDSTLDRAGIHAVIYDALGLTNEIGEAGVLCEPSFKQGVVIEAEMVAFSDVLGRIDEFWRIRSLIASTAIGVRHRSPMPGPSSTQREAMETQCSLVSNASDGGTRHLALVFFDVLLLDGVSLLPLPYGERRAALERLVHVRPGYAMLAERTCVDLRRANAADALRRVFAHAIANHQEGVVIKAEGARYAEKRWPWVKLKQDYIPGHGDAVDLVILAASWEKDRARELRVPPTAYTTFYFGALSNPDELKDNPTCLPRFEIIFTSSYGLGREELEELNFMIKSSDPVPYRNHSAPGLSYTYHLGPGVPPPAVFLREPLLAEVFGAGFTKAPRSLIYELRFPRIAKVFRPSDRPWTDGVALPELQQLARAAVGRDRPGKAEDDWARAVFRPDEPASPGARCPVKRKHTEEAWVRRLAEVDARAAGRSPTKRARGEAEGVVRVAVNEDRGLENGGGSVGVAGPSGSPKQREGMSRLRSVTNVTSSLAAGVPFVEASLSRGAPDKGPCTPGPSKRLRTPDLLEAHSPPQPPPSESALHLRPMPSSPPSLPKTPQRGRANAPAPMTAQKTEPAPGPHSALPTPPSSTPDLTLTAHPTAPTRLAPRPTGLMITVHQFLQDAAVWLARPHHAPRPAWRAPSHAVIPRGNALSTLDALLAACGWTNDDGDGGRDGPLSSTRCAWAARGVVFVDDPADAGAQAGDGGNLGLGLAGVMTALATRRAEALRAARGGTCKPVYVFSARVLAHDTLGETATAEEWERRAVCRFG
ncbi:hypothetical protein C8Q79DRAFT_251688 [Trametes meyenii]|nr:hypothetical protein C8Q79DRAFT_251688 [Trametes meyenii]